MAAGQRRERRCRVCGAVLSQYNHDARCFPCQESGRAYLNTKRELSKIEKLLQELYPEEDASQEDREMDIPVEKIGKGTSLWGGHQ